MTLARIAKLVAGSLAGGSVAFLVFGFGGAVLGMMLGLAIGPFCGRCATASDFSLVGAMGPVMGAAIVGIPCAVAGLYHGAVAGWRNTFSGGATLTVEVESFVGGAGRYVIIGERISSGGNPIRWCAATLLSWL